MHDGMTPQGQMELRLEAFQYTSLTDLKVEACSTVTASYVFDDGDYYEFTVSPGGNGTPVFSWQAVNIGDFNLHTMSRECKTDFGGGTGASSGTNYQCGIIAADR